MNQCKYPSSLSQLSTKDFSHKNLTTPWMVFQLVVQCRVETSLPKVTLHYVFTETVKCVMKYIHMSYKTSNTEICQPY